MPSSNFAQRIFIGALALALGGCVSLWITRDGNSLHEQNKYLRERLVSMQASLCKREIALHESTALTMLQKQLDNSQRLVLELQAQLRTCTEQRDVMSGRLCSSNTNATEASMFMPIAPYHPKKMREVLDWESFDRGYVYSWRRYWRVNGHQGNLRRELQEAITTSKDYLEDKTFAWQHGQFQLDTRRGITYLMDFEKMGPKGTKHFKRIRMFRPMSSIVVHKPDFTPKIDPQNRSVHIVTTVSGRADLFDKFLQRLPKALVTFENVRLTVVNFVGTPDGSNSTIAMLQKSLNMFSKSHRLQYHLVHKREAFSRGRGLEYGVNEAPKRATPESTLEEVLFFCDIDMHFTYEFLYRCKANAIPGDSLYFPISFSLFKGKSVQVVHENGDWRTYGLGMVCISTTDFLASKGFSKTITGWGREDVDFYEHMLKNTSLTVLRSVDEGLVHIWHPKECNQAQLSADQFSDCVQSRADWEGDKLYLSRKLASYENVYGDIDFESARNSTTIRAAVTKAKHQ
eukprot:m.887333 g.887333  ORF g.887333 m.887333 type:complete len:515 (-) comp23636_c0_seq6:1896-3440(-)